MGVGVALGERVKEGVEDVVVVKVEDCREDEKVPLALGVTERELEGRRIVENMPLLIVKEATLLVVKMLELVTALLFDRLEVAVVPESVEEVGDVFDAKFSNW